MYTNQINHGDVAQLAEQRTSNPPVRGSKPLVLTIISLALAFAVALPAPAFAAKARHAGAAKAKSYKKPAARVQAEIEEEKPQIELVRAPRPVRSELGCNEQEGGLAAVGKVVTVEGKHLRCQKTYDFASGKLEATPGWVEVFMPSATLGAGLRETQMPAETVMPSFMPSRAKVELSADSLTPEGSETPVTESPASRPAAKNSDAIHNYLY